MSNKELTTKSYEPFPWQSDNWNTVCQATRAGRMAHAILFSGPEGIGLEHFAHCLTASLLCESSGSDGHACGTCRSCHLIQGGSHSDLLTIEPEDTGKQIKVDEVRKLIDFIHLKSQFGRYKISVITPADAMNRSAANSLLKTLEEPPEQSLLILLSHKPNLLPITIRSRCQHIRFNPAFDAATVSWVTSHIPEELTQDDNTEQLLRMAGGAPLAIESMLENHSLEYQRNILEDLFALSKRQVDPIKIAEKWKAYDTTHVLLWLTRLFADMVRIKLLSRPVRISDSALIERLQVLLKQLELRDLTGFYHLLLENYSLSTGSISYNAQGLLENVIIFWQRLNHKVK